MRFLRLFECLRRVIERLLRKLVRGEVILLAVMRGRDPVRMGRNLVHFRGYSMCVPWHAFLPRPAYTLVRTDRALSATRRP
jgi:hypothetical protein